MRVLITGASGLVGRRLAESLTAKRHDVIAVSRDPKLHDWPYGLHVLTWDAASEERHLDAIVNLAGESVWSHRWSKRHAFVVRNSRLVATRRVAALAALQPRPPVVVSASAIGYYGTMALQPCPESAAPGDDELASLCKEWESAAANPGRTAIVRIGHVLSDRGGYLKEIRPFARKGLAGRIGSGAQPMSWIHLDDAVASIEWLLGEPTANGAYNLVSPGSVGCTQAQFAAALGASLGRPRQVPIPTWFMALRFGRGARHFVCGGQDVRPERLTTQGFKFRHQDLKAALASFRWP